MSDLIDRQAVIDALCDEYCGGWQDCKHYPKCENLKAIQNLPSAQPERAMGKWMDTDNYYQRWKCSVCGCHTRDAKPPYCPNCGARMMEEQYE